METAPVAGSMIAASTNADWSGSVSWHGPAFGSVADSVYGVVSPAALVGAAGTVSVQFGLPAAASAGAGSSPSAWSPSAPSDAACLSAGAAAGSAAAAP